tara:strand:- start:4069 stop:4464 length:396 start_codon:yes stop_codon:yes gene_type:complete
MRILTSFILYLFCVFIVKSQDEIKIQYMDTKIQDVIKFQKIKKSNKNLTIYSIQLKASETPQDLKKVKNKYKTLFPNEIIDEVFEPPYFKIIIGRFLDKKEAEKKLQLIQKNFKSSFILKREITMKQLLNK